MAAFTPASTLLGSIIALSLIFASTGAHAVTITFTESDNFLFVESDVNLPTATPSLTALVPKLLADETGQTAGLPSTARLDVPFNVAANDNGIIFLTEPGAAEPGGEPPNTISDSLQAILSMGNPGSITFFFRSDPTQADFLRNCATATETGNKQGIGRFSRLAEDGRSCLADQTFALPAGLNVQVQSDAPGPSTLLLLGSALAGLAGLTKIRQYRK